MKLKYKTIQYVLAAVVILLNSLLVIFDRQSLAYNSILTIDGVLVLYVNSTSKCKFTEFFRKSILVVF